METFQLNTFLSENRETIIKAHTGIAAHAFFNGISLKDFMIQVMNTMKLNHVKSEKRAISLLPSIIEGSKIANTKADVKRDRDAELAEKYKGTAYMALV